MTERLIVTAGVTVPAGTSALLVGEPPAEAPEDHVLRRAQAFPRDADGAFAEALPEAAAILQLEDFRRGGATCLIVPAAFRDWLVARHGLSGHLEGHYAWLADDAACCIFDLRDSPVARLLDAMLDPAEPVVTLVREGTTLPLGPRPVRRVESLVGVEAAGATERFLVVPDAAPWAPTDPDLLQSLERRYRKVATRPQVCEMFELSRA